MLNKTCENIINELKSQKAKMEEMGMTMQLAAEYIETNRLINHFEGLLKELEEKTNAVNEK